MEPDDAALGQSLNQGVQGERGETSPESPSRPLRPGGFADRRKALLPRPRHITPLDAVVEDLGSPDSPALSHPRQNSSVRDLAPPENRGRVSISSVSSKSSGRTSIWSAHSVDSVASADTTYSHALETTIPPPPRAMSVSPPPKKSCIQPWYHCTVCDASFVRKFDWRRHEEDFHEPWKRYPCPRCNRIFLGRNTFKNHYENAHDSVSQPCNPDQVLVVTRMRKCWACGICGGLTFSSQRYIDHVGRHFEDGKSRLDWNHSLVIYGLLHQPLVYDAWKAVSSDRQGQHGDRRPIFSWHPRTTGRAPGFIGGDAPGQLQDLLEFFSGDSVDAASVAALAYQLADILFTALSPLPSPTVSGSSPQLSLSVQQLSPALTAVPKSRHAASATGTLPPLSENPVSAFYSLPIRPRSHTTKVQEGLAPLPSISSSIKRRPKPLDLENGPWLSHTSRHAVQDNSLGTGSEILIISPPWPNIPTHDEQSTPLTSPTSGSDLSIDSDLLSVSELSEENELSEFLDRNDKLFPVLSQTLRTLLGGFEGQRMAANERQYGSKGVSAESSRGIVHQPSGEINKSKPSSKKHNRSEDSEEGDEDGLGRGKRKKADVGTSASPPRFLACPYWKHDPRQSRDCSKLRLRRIRDVKQHLHRRHAPEFYCERCFAIFPTNDSHQHHIMSVHCTRLADAQLDGISHAQRRALSKKSSPGLGEEAQWYAIWAILFPSYQKPASAYIDSELSADLCLFREHWQRMGPGILLETLRSHRWPELSIEEQEVQGRRILAEGLDRIYEGWLLSNMLSASSGSNADTPSVNSPNRTVSTASNRTSRISPPPMQAESIVAPTEAENSEAEHFQADFVVDMANWGAWDLEEINPYTEGDTWQDGGNWSSEHGHALP